MNREEIGKWLESLKQDIWKATYSDLWHYEQAVDMAIEALEEPTVVRCENCIHVKSCRKVIILKNRTYKLVRYCSNGVKRKQP